MSSTYIFSCVNALEENPKDIYLEITTLLLKIADNILREPSNAKFRSIRLSNPTVANKLLPSIGAMECLFMMGFEEGEDSLFLPTKTLLENVKKIREAIAKGRSQYVDKLTKSAALPSSTSVQQHPSSTSQPSILSNTRPAQSSAATQAVPCSTSSPSTSANLPRPSLLSGSQHNSFLKKIETNFKNVLQYEDKVLQAKARQLIPITELEIAAMKNMRSLQLVIKQGKTKEPEGDIQDYVLVELLHWFKNSFFKWVDAPCCEYCAGSTKFVGAKTDSSNSADRVEIYKCTLCTNCTYFHRYNNVEKLLETRQGRCGEWANCFTLFSRAMGWDARHIVDETDHVWTEVYSSTQGRWLHCDPCENACDKPLMYEHGWGKKLSYVIAYSRDEIQDVTWRYSSNHKDILSRRNRCNEEALLATITYLKRARQEKLSLARRNYLDKRLLKELVEFLVAKHPSGNDLGGRSSGSLSWRLARGETSLAEIKSHVWVPTDGEIELGKMQIGYSAAADKYTRVTDNSCDDSILQSFQNGAWEIKSVTRKVEKDWKKAYLTRTEGSEVGTIQWKFDLGDRGIIVDKVAVACPTAVFESGKVRWLLCSEENCVLVDSDKAPFQTDAFRGATSVTLSAELSGGKGNQAWQHAQLFRQDLSDFESYPLEISIWFRKK